MPRLSLRRLWTTYKRLAIEDGIASSPRDLAIAQAAFYGGARGVLMVLDHVAETGDYDELHKTLDRFDRQIQALKA